MVRMIVDGHPNALIYMGDLCLAHLSSPPGLDAQQSRVVVVCVAPSRPEKKALAVLVVRPHVPGFEALVPVAFPSLVFWRFGHQRGIMDAGNGSGSVDASEVAVPGTGIHKHADLSVAGSYNCTSRDTSAKPRVDLPQTTWELHPNHMGTSPKPRGNFGSRVGRERCGWTGPSLQENLPDTVGCGSHGMNAPPLAHDKPSAREGRLLRAKPAAISAPRGETTTS